MAGNVIDPNAQPQGGGGFQALLDQIMQIWPDWAAAQGLEPPADGQPMGFPGKGGAAPVPQPGPATAPIDPAIQAQASATTASPAPLPPTENPPPDPTEEAMRQNAMWDANDPSQYGIQPVAQENLFPADMLTPPASDLANVAKLEPAQSSPLMSTAGAALSGLKTPETPQYGFPRAPDIPATRDPNYTLLQLLQAAGLQAPQTPTGMSLGQRIK